MTKHGQGRVELMAELVEMLAELTDESMAIVQSRVADLRGARSRTDLSVIKKNSQHT